MVPHLWPSSGSKTDASRRPQTCAAPAESACERRTQPSGGWRGGTGARRAQLGSRGRACGAIRARCVGLPSPGRRGGERPDCSPGGGGGVGRRGGLRRSLNKACESSTKRSHSLSLARASSIAISVVTTLRFPVTTTVLGAAPAPRPARQRSAAWRQRKEMRPADARARVDHDQVRDGGQCCPHAIGAGVRIAALVTRPRRVDGRIAADMRAEADCGKGRGLSRRGPICKQQGPLGSDPRVRSSYLRSSYPLEVAINWLID